MSDMRNPFLRKTSEERVIKAVERLKFDVQYALQAAMKKRSVDQAGLARRLGVTPARVSQMFADDANLRLDTVAKAFAVLDEEIFFYSETVPEIPRLIEPKKKTVGRRSWKGEFDREIAREAVRQEEESQERVRLETTETRRTRTSGSTEAGWKTVCTTLSAPPVQCAAANEWKKSRGGKCEAA